MGAAGTAGGGINDLTIVNGDLTLAGTLGVSALTGFGAGVYELFAYTGTLTDTGLSLGTLPTGFGYKLDETSTPGEVLLDVTSTGSLQGDVNNDGIVNSQDLAIVALRVATHRGRARRGREPRQHRQLAGFGRGVVPVAANQRR